MTIADIARVCHEANRAYCQSLGDTSQLPWDDAPEWQRESAAAGVALIALHPETTPEQSHANWLADKYEAGWTYGPVKDVEKKQHPCFMTYDALPQAQKVKDHLFGAVVRALMGELHAPQP